MTHDDERVVLPRNPHLYFSEQNWDMQDSGIALSVNPGAYLKLAFVNSSFITLRLQPVSQAKATLVDTGDSQSRHSVRPPPPPTAVDGHYMNLIYTVDNGPYAIVPVLNSTSEIVLATGLTHARTRSI
jgi:hypothetical protein